MLRKLLLYFQFILITGAVLSQTAQGLIDRSKSFIRVNEDSAFFYIENALKIIPQGNNSLKIKALRWKGELMHYYGYNLQDLEILLGQAVKLAEQNEMWSIVCEIYIDLGYFHRYRNKYPKADDYYAKSLAIAEEKQLPEKRADANNAMGAINYYKGNHTEALNHYKEAVKYYAETQDSLKISKAYNNIAIIYKNQRSYEKAIEYYTKSISIYEKSPDFKEAILRNRIYNLSRAYTENGNYELAEKTIRRMIALDKAETSEPESYIISLITLLEHFIDSKQFDRAFDFEKEIEHTLDSMELTKMLPEVHMRLAWAYQDFGDLDSALYYLKLHEPHYVSNRDEQLSYEFYKNISEILLEISPKEAPRYAYDGLKLAQEIEIKEWIYKMHLLLYKAHKLLNNVDQALNHHELYHSYQDSLWNEEKSIEVGIMQNEIELVEAEAKNELLRTMATLQSQQIRSQNIVIGAIAVISILLIVIALLFRKQLKERKLLLEKIEAQSNKLHELDKAKTRFFANISHDLRSPLTLILGALDRITERDYDILDKESRELLDTGIKNGKRLLYMADEIMDLTRLEEGKVNLELQYVKIVPYLRLLTKMFSSAADIKSIELKFTNHADDETVLQIDPHQFEKIIYNLLSNAIKFTPENGRVDVQLSAEKAHLEISISDSGPGIPKESLDLIFNRYYQSSKSSVSQAGVGIGLALVKELIELHRGTIQASSGGSGSVFTIRLPFKKSDWVSKAIVPERSLDVVTRNSLWVDLQEEKERLQIPGIRNQNADAKAVLIVEDHKELRMYLQSILGSEYRIFLASNGTTALDILQSENIDLIITDLMMPYMDGFELVDQLKKDKELKKIPVVVVSARTDKKEKLDLISKGAEDVISKPFDKDELLVRIKNIMAKEWDSNTSLSKLYGETAEEFEKNIMHRLETLIIRRIDDAHLSVLDLADEMAASERKVYRMIKKISGLTPYELIKEVRWQYLENYLKENKIRTATEAAQLIGMNNVSSFSSQYEKRFGHPFKTVLSS